MIYWLDPDDLSCSFPDVKHALREPNGLLALGGDLSAQRLLNAYRKGIFPWYSDNQPILWWSPDPRAVLFPRQLKVSRSLKKKLRNGQFTVTVNHAFNRVIEACAVTPRPTQNGTWITDEIKLAYCKLHEMGYAHSVEAWENGKLVGGLYGIAIGCVFFGESMFMRKTDASKVAFAHLVRWLESRNYHLIDCQVETEHLKSLGAECIPRNRFIRLLDQYCMESCGSLVGEHNLSGEITWE